MQNSTDGAAMNTAKLGWAGQLANSTTADRNCLTECAL